MTNHELTKEFFKEIFEVDYDEVEVNFNNTQEEWMGFDFNTKRNLKKDVNE